MGSGVWAFAIGLHTFASVIFGYRLSNTTFIVAIVLLWVFIYGAAAIGVAMHPDLFTRAVAWCWIDSKYGDLRLWLHYFWIFIFEFGTVIIYGVMIAIVRVRISTNFYRSKEQARQAQDAAKLMVAYPLIYIVCTLPLATLRMYNIRNTNTRISPTWFCFAGVMITSNGWMDVLLYTLTRRIALFSDEPPTTDNGIESFGTPFRSNVFGTETSCEHAPDTSIKRRSDDTELFSILEKKPSYRPRRAKNKGPLNFAAIREKKTIEVTSEPMTDEELLAAKQLRDGNTIFPATESRDFDQESMRELWDPSGSNNSPNDDFLSTPQGGSYDIESLDFKTKPAGY